MLKRKFVLGFCSIILILLFLAPLQNLVWFFPPQIPCVQASPAYEDFLADYTEVDPNNHIDVTQFKCQANGLTRNEDAYVYKDFGVNYFDGDFEHEFKTHTIAGDGMAIRTWLMANDVPPFNAAPYIMIIQWVGSIYVYSANGASDYDGYTAGDGWTADSDRWIRINRTGTGVGAITCKIYTDAFSTLDDTLVIDDYGVDFRYLYAMHSYNSGNSVSDSVCFIENLDLQEAEPQVNSVTLNSPVTGTQTSLTVSFNFTPTFYQTIQNASVYTNETGTWTLEETNSSAITNASANIISHTLPSSAEGAILWNVGVFNSTAEVFATSNATFTLDIAPRYQNVDSNATSIAEGGTILLYGQGYDGIGLRYGVLATNETGSWKNYTAFGFVKNGTDDYFAQDGVSQPFNFIDYPSGVYYNGRTYIVWQGEGTTCNIFVTYYNHSSESWGGIVKVADNPLSSDDHGAPAICIDANHYLHVFYGAHGGAMKHAKSDSAESISAWTVQSNPVSASTYLQLVTDGSNMYLFYRSKTPANNWCYKKSADNGETWGSQNAIIGFSSYAGGVQFDDTNDRIHVAWCTRSDPVRRHIYHAYLKLSDSHMYNMIGTDLGTSISESEANTYCKVVDTPSDETNHPSYHVDSNGYPWIIYIKGSGTSWTFYHVRWSGSSWTSPASILTTDHRWNFADFIIHALDDVTAYLTASGSAGHGGDIEEWSWNGVSWSKTTTILTQSESGQALNAPMVPVNHASGLLMAFCQVKADYTTALKLYGWAGSGAEYYDSPKDMEDIADTWTWSNFTWSNSSISAGTQIQWRIYYEDTHGNVNGTGVHTFNVNTAPTINQLNLTLTTDNINITSISVNTYYHWKINVTDIDTLADLENVTVRIENNPSNTILEDSPTFTEDSEYWFNYENSTSAWEWYDGSQWNDTDLIYLNQTGCSTPTLSETNGWYVFEAKLSKIATHASTWEFSALVFDSGDENDSATFSGISIYFYSETSVPTNHYWYNINPDTANQTVDGGSIQVNITCNANVDMKAKGDGALTGTTYPSNTIPLSNVLIHNDTLADAISLTVSYQDIPELTNLASGYGTYYVVLWATVPDGTIPDDYVYTLTITCLEHT